MNLKQVNRLYIALGITLVGTVILGGCSKSDQPDSSATSADTTKTTTVTPAPGAPPSTESTSSTAGTGQNAGGEHPGMDAKKMQGMFNGGMGGNGASAGHGGMGGGGSTTGHGGMGGSGMGGSMSQHGPGNSPASK